MLFQLYISTLTPIVPLRHISYHLRGLSPVSKLTGSQSIIEQVCKQRKHLVNTVSTCKLPAINAFLYLRSKRATLSKNAKHAGCDCSKH